MMAEYLSKEIKNKLRTEAPTNPTKKKTKIRIFVLGVFAFCWAPFTILTILKAYFISESRIVTILGSYFAALGLLNSGLNWIV
jgi:hypothetical protein